MMMTKYRTISVAGESTSVSLRPLEGSRSTIPPSVIAVVNMCCSCVFKVYAVDNFLTGYKHPRVSVALQLQSPLQLYWILPSKTGSAVTHSCTGLAGADHFVFVEGGDSLLDS